MRKPYVHLLKASSLTLHQNSFPSFMIESSAISSVLLPSCFISISSTLALFPELLDYAPAGFCAASLLCLFAIRKRYPLGQTQSLRSLTGGWLEAGVHFPPWLAHINAVLKLNNRPEQSYSLLLVTLAANSDYFLITPPLNFCVVYIPVQFFFFFDDWMSSVMVVPNFFFTRLSPVTLSPLAVLWMCWRQWRLSTDIGDGLLNASLSSPFTVTTKSSFACTPSLASGYLFSQLHGSPGPSTSCLLPLCVVTISWIYFVLLALKFFSAKPHPPPPHPQKVKD